MSSQHTSAQEHKRVEVTTIYTPEVEKSTKLDVPATVAEGSDIEPEIDYNVTPETWQIKLQDHNFKPAKASYWDYNRAEHCYTRLSAGYPFMTDAELRYMTQNVRVGYFGAGINHKANFSPQQSGLGVQRSIADGYDMQNGVNAGGGVILGRRMLEANVDYNFDIYNTYAVAGKPSRLYFNDADVVVRYGDNFADLSRMNFSVEAHGGYWSHVPPVAAADSAIPEYRLGLSAQLMRDFKGNVVGLGAEYDMWQATASSYRDIRFGATFDYSRDFGLVAIDASLGYLYDRVLGREQASHFILPALRADFDLHIDALRPYLDINSTVSQNGASQLYGENPFLDYGYSEAVMLGMPNTLSYNLSAGITGVAFSSRLSYRAYVAMNLMRDYVSWYMIDMAVFAPAAADNNRLAFGTEVEYRPLGGLSIGAMFYLHSDNSRSEYAISDARMRGALDVKYNIKRWKFYLQGELMGRRCWSLLEADGSITKEAFSAPARFDLGAGVGYRLSQRFEIFVDGYNLLNQEIYDYAYYGRNGIGFMAGVKIDF